MGSNGFPFSKLGHSMASVHITCTQSTELHSGKGHCKQNMTPGSLRACHEAQPLGISLVIRPFATIEVTPLPTFLQRRTRPWTKFHRISQDPGSLAVLIKFCSSKRTKESRANVYHRGSPIVEQPYEPWSTLLICPVMVSSTGIIIMVIKTIPVNPPPPGKKRERGS